MQVSRIRALRGPNLWTRHTAVEAVVTCTEQECSLEHLPGFEEQLSRLFPAMGALPVPPSDGKLSTAHALERVTLALQTQAGCAVSFSRTTPAPEEGVYQVVVQYSEEGVGRLAFDLACKLCEAAQQGGSFDLEEIGRAHV